MESKEKRVVAVLIPYTFQNGKPLVFLQKRSDTAERNPGGISCFGGGVEPGETIEEGLLREIKEELHFVPKDYAYLGGYGNEYDFSHCYIMEVGDDFESQIVIGEGEYGKFFSEEELEHEPRRSANNKKVIGDLFQKLKEAK